MARTFETVGVVGLGIMGAGIAEVFARAGLRVIGVEADPAALERGRGHLDASTGKAVARGRLTEAQRDEIAGRMTFTTSLADLAQADLVVEAVPEVMAIKRELLGELDRICEPSAVLATNTSSLAVTELAAGTGRPGRVVGMHFFNPAPVMGLVEVIHTVLTEDGLAEDVAALARRIGKTPLTVGDRAGFVVNRLLLGYLNHAVTLLEAGVATRDDIDCAMTVGAGLPTGPFALLDLIGLDTSYEVCEVLFAESRDRRHAPAPTLRELVAAGMLGRKTGRGFYDYGDDKGSVPAAGPKSTATTVAIVGECDLGERLDTAGFKVVGPEEADVVLALAEAPVVRFAGGQPHPDRVVGLHLVGESLAEVIPTALTSVAAAAAAHDLVKVLDRTPVVAKDRAGFIVNALLFPYLNDAVRMYECGYATIEDIDAAMRLGCRYPAGPFEMLDMIGLETVRDGLRALYEEYREPSFAPAPLLDRLVTAGVRGIGDHGKA